MPTTSCAVQGCTNNKYTLRKWQRNLCDIHGVFFGTGVCDCNPPFHLHCFPTNPALRKQWVKAIRRVDLKTGKTWEPDINSRICSVHFEDGVPYPSLHLGHPAFKPMKIRRTSNKQNEELLRLPKPSKCSLSENNLRAQSSSDKEGRPSALYDAKQGHDDSSVTPEPEQQTDRLLRIGPMKDRHSEDEKTNSEEPFPVLLTSLLNTNNSPSVGFTVKKNFHHNKGTTSQTNTDCSSSSQDGWGQTRLSEKVYVNEDQHSKLMTKLATLWREEQLCDAIITVGKDSVKAHKVVLVAACPILMLGEDSYITLRINLRAPVDIDTVNTFLVYLYDGILRLTSDNVRKMKLLATSLRETTVLKFCSDFEQTHVPVVEQICTVDSHQAEKKVIPRTVDLKETCESLINVTPKQTACGPVLENYKALVNCPSNEIKMKVSRKRKMDSNLDSQIPSSKPVTETINMAPNIIKTSVSSGQSERTFCGTLSNIMIKQEVDDMESFDRSSTVKSQEVGCQESFALNATRIKQEMNEIERPDTNSSVLNQESDDLQSFDISGTVIKQEVDDMENVHQ